MGIRTDLIFRRNREVLQRLQRQRGHPVAVALTVGLVAAFGVGVWIVRWGPVAKAGGWRAWLQREARALILGRHAFENFAIVLEASELTPGEKQAWRQYVEDRRVLIEKAGGAVLTSSDLTEGIRGVLESAPGLYYALGWIAEQDVTGSSLRPVEKKALGRILRDAQEILREGQTRKEDWRRARASIHGALHDCLALRKKSAALTETPYLGVFLAAVRDVVAKGKLRTDRRAPIDPAREWRRELERLRVAWELPPRERAAASSTALRSPSGNADGAHTSLRGGSP